MSLSVRYRIRSHIAPANSSAARRTGLTASLLVILVLLGATITTWLLSRHDEALPQFKQRKLTANAEDLPVLDAAISPDGKYLGYAIDKAFTCKSSIPDVPRTCAVPIGIQPEAAYWAFGNWFPDSRGFIASVRVPGKPVSFWSIRIPEGRRRSLPRLRMRLGKRRFRPMVPALHI